MANYVKFKQGLKKDFNTTNQPLTNGMIYFVIDENNHGSIYYDTIVDGKKATKNGTVHRVKFSGLPIKITGSVIGTGVISQDGETIEINTSTNHSHGLAHQNFTVTLSNDDTNLKWTRLGNQNGGGFWLKSIRGQTKAPAWFLPDFSAGIAFGGSDTKGIISVRYSQPSVRFAGGNGDAPVWYFTITGANDKTYDLSKIGGHSSDSAKLDHNVTFKIASTADATKGGNGTATNLSGSAVDLYLPTKISGFDLLQASRFQGNADSATYATSAGYAKGLFLNPETRQEDMNFNLADAKYIKRVTYSMATSTTKKNKPPIGDANILSFGWDNSGYGSQLAIQNGGAGHLAVRGSGSTNGASSWGEWSTVLDSSNYTSYINNYYWANVKVSTASSMETKPTFNTAYTSNWWRSTGKTGWWNDTYSGGIAMEDTTYVKVAGNKSFLIPNGSLKIGGNGNILFATGVNDATLKIYGQNIKDYGTETIAIQTCFDNQDPQTSGYTTQYAKRCNLLLQPRGGQVYIGVNLTTVGDPGYKLLVGGNQWINGNLVFNGAKEIKFIGSKATYSMIRFIDNTSDTYGNGISIGGGGSTVIGAGESAMSYVTNGGDERLFLLSDGAINIEAGGSTISDRKGLQVTSDGHILPIKAENSNPNTQDLGSAADYWRNLYINNITLQGQTGNRLVWTNGSKILQAGYHYADTDRIAINTAGRQGYNFYVNGSSYFSSNTYIHRNYFLNNPSTGSGELVLTALGYKSAGYPVYNDPEFAKGANGVSVYNNSGNGTVTHAVVSDSSSGNSSGKVLKITHTGTASPGLGGFRLGMQSRANAVLIQIFRAKIPSGYNLSLHMNAIGNNTRYEWLTPNTGTGRWEWYANRMICGSTGTFNDGGYVAINLNNGTAAPTASSPLVWYLSYCNVIDVTKGNYDGLRTRYSDFVTYDSGEDGKDNKTPINDKYVAKIVTKTSNGTTFTFRGLNGAGNELTDAVLTIPNAGSDKAGLITNAAQGIYGEKTLHENLRFANVSTGIRGIIGTIADNDFWRVVGRADATNSGYLEIATGDDTNEPIYMRQYSGAFGTIKRTFTILDAAGRSRAPELFEAKKVHVNSGLNQSNAIVDIGYQFQVTGTSNFTDSVNISGVTTHHNHIQMDANYSFSKPGHSVSWNQSHSTAMIRITTVSGWTPILAQKSSTGYWTLGHWDNDKFKDEWVIGFLSDTNLSGVANAKNELTTKYRLRNVGGEKNLVFASYNAQVGSSTNPTYIKQNGEAVACSYSLSATIEAGTANRMAYYKTANQIGSSGHYVTSSQVGINSNTTYDFTFYVGGNSYFSNLVTVYAGNNLGVKIGNTNITAIDGSLILQNNTALRFGSSEWDWNKWAGLKYVPSSKTIVMGLADSTNFTANAVQSGGTFLFTGMSSIDLNKTASIKNLAVGGGIYWNPYVESTTDASDAASITVIKAGCAGGTELRISQMNDANDVINLVTNKYIYLNSKKAFSIQDGWLRINDEKGFSSGIYTGTSLIRSDNQLQVGDSGNKFYANSNGNGYFSNTLGIAGTNINYKLYVNGNSYFNGTLRAKGPIEIGSNVNGRGNNYIAFYGTTGDNPGSFNHTYIGENLWGGSESSELVLFKGNDLGSNDNAITATGAGVDRIRHIAAGHVFQIYRSSLSGSFDAICTSTVPSTVVEMNGSGLMISGLNSTSFTPNGASAAVTVNRSILTIYGTTYGNTAGQLKSNTAGVMSYGDGGPQIDFSASRTGGQRGAIIFTDHDSAGSGSSWHFVSTESDWSVNSKRFVAKSSVTIGQNLQNSSYNLYVNGTSYFNGNTTHNGIIYFANGTTYSINNSADATLRRGIFRGTSNSSTATGSYFNTGALEVRESNCVGNAQSAFAYAPRIGFHWGNRIAASLSFHSDGIFYFRKQNGTDRAVVDCLATRIYDSNNGNAINVTYSKTGQASTSWLASWNGYELGAISPANITAGKATQLATARNIVLSGNLQGSASFNGTGDATITALNYQSSINGGNTYNYPWHRIATTVVGTGQYNDRSALLRIRHTFNGGGEGLVKVSVRTNSAGSGCDISAIWLYRYNITANNIGIGLWGVTGDNVYLDVYYKCAMGWPRAIVESISNGRIFTLISSNEANDTTTTDKKTSSEVYTSIENGATLIHGKAYTKIVYGSDGVDNGRYVLKTGDTMTGHLKNNSEFITTSQNGFRISAASRTSTKSILLRSDGSNFYILCCNSAAAGNNWYTPTGGAAPLRINLTTGYSYFSRAYGAVWNDYAEYRSTSTVKPGQCVIETGLGDLVQSTKRLQPGANIVSDTFGFAIGETEQTKTPIAVSGRVLAYPYEDRDSYQAGDPVCSGPNGTISKMTREEVREYPDRIIGTVSEIPDYEVWGTGNVKVNNRIWIKVK